MTEVIRQTIITPTDRLGLTICLAIICHAIVVLGVTFANEDLRKARYNTMDIVLVQQRSKLKDDAKLLAQASLEGGGDTDEELTPSTPLPPPFPDNQPEVAAPPPSAVKQAASAPAKEAAVEPEPAPAAARELLAVDNSVTSVSSKSNDRRPETEPQAPLQAAEKSVQEKKPAKPQPSATALLANSLKIAALSARVDRRLLAKGERPKRKFISASTREYKYAAYMEAWRAKVERVGNLNYPEEARKRDLSGSLVLDVALNPDGSINMITVRQPSGHKVLDDAAIRIVKLAAPFSPFPDSIQGETDILHIIRTWQFLKKGGFR